MQLGMVCHASTPSLKMHADASSVRQVQGENVLAVMHAEGGTAANATALAIAKAFWQGGSTASAVAQAVAQVIQSQGCSAIMPTLASARLAHA